MGVHHSSLWIHFLSVDPLEESDHSLSNKHNTLQQNASILIEITMMKIGSLGLIILYLIQFAKIFSVPQNFH